MYLDVNLLIENRIERINSQYAGRVIFERRILFKEYFGSYSCYKGKCARYKSSWDLYLIRKIENRFGIL
jgi:hypothetical protein